MGRYRIYPDKNTTIMSKYQSRNTGLNPVSELWYGKYGRSRLLIDFDMDEINQVFSDGIINSATVLSYKLVLTDCSPVGSPTHRSPKNFSLEIAGVDQDWHEGAGYDFLRAYYGSVLQDDNANWIKSTDGLNWSGGSYDEGYYYTAVTFGIGNENVEIDVTDYVMSGLTGSVSPFHGFLVKYSGNTEMTFSSSTSTSAWTKQFYTRHTHTIYKPYIEIEYDDFVDDDRSHMISGITNTLYLYTQIGSNLQDVYSAVSCAVKSGNGQVISSTTQLSISGINSGIYGVDFKPTGIETGITLYDHWTVEQVNNGIRAEFINEFVVSSATFNIGGSISSIPNRYDINIPQMKTQYEIGDDIFMWLRIRQQFSTATTTLDNLYYKVVNGPNDYTMIDWSKVSKTNGLNFVHFNTSWFYTGTNYTIKFKDNGNVSNIDYDDVFNFEIS
jgi:hypothetical protein